MGTQTLLEILERGDQGTETESDHNSGVIFDDPSAALSPVANLLLPKTRSSSKVGDVACSTSNSFEMYQL